MSAPETVFVVDDNAGIRKGLELALSARGYAVAAYASAEAFLDATGADSPGCLVLDVLMPGTSGTELQQQLRRLGNRLPIIFITGHGDIPMAVRSMRRGALDFLEKPFSLDALVERIDEALDEDRRNRASQMRAADVHGRLETLTKREREIFDLLVRSRGMSSKELARSLGISHRTVEVHRGRVMSKLNARSVAELIDMAAVETDTRSTAIPRADSA